jgi:hypothetical protein
MAFYFFHICDGRIRIADEEGLDVENLEAARRELRANGVDNQGEGRGRLQRVDLDTIKKWPRVASNKTRMC